MAYRLHKAEHLRMVSSHVPILNPAEAEIHFTFAFDSDVTDIELDGRLVGPRCPYASTVEIPYPFRPLPGQCQPDSQTVMGRVVIPEPSFWDPISPFLYQGRLEVCSKGQPLIQLDTSIGLRTFQVDNKTLRWNGKSMKLNGSRRCPDDEIDARVLRGRGCNTLLVSAADIEVASVCENIADRFGFVTLTSVESLPELADAISVIHHHACSLGWVLPQTIIADVSTSHQIGRLVSGPRQILGVHVVDPDSFRDGPDISFLICTRELLPRLQHVDKPKLLDLGDQPMPQMPDDESILGYISDPIA